jgi:hypothetical protein
VSRTEANMKFGEKEVEEVEEKIVQRIVSTKAVRPVHHSPRANHLTLSQPLSRYTELG